MRLKRTFDVVVICLAAVVWVPVVLVAALAVLVASGRPIFYRSDRFVGPGAAIDMLKLRVMVRDADKVTDCSAGDAFLNTVNGSSLYTGVGRVLDRLGLNEIPQFVHVLRGQMSIVGARPLTRAVRQSLHEQHQFIDDRWLTPAGLTGLPQLVGRSALTPEDRLRLEAAYSRRVLQRYSFRVDFQILLLTVLITFGLHKPLTVEGALAVVSGREATAPVARLTPTYELAGPVDAA